MKSSKLFLSLLFAVNIALCQTAITGKVIDTLGNPIRGVYVRLSVAGLNDTTDSTGQFVLKSSLTENKLAKNIHSLLCSPFIKNKVLFFSVLHPGTQVTADVFSVSGRLVAHVLNESFSSGVFHVDLTFIMKNYSRNAVFFVWLKIGNKVYTLKLALMDIINVNKVTISNPTLNALLKNSTAVNAGIVDTIIVTRKGYYDEYKSVSSYLIDVGLIKLFNGNMPTIEEQNSIKDAINGISMVVSKIDTALSVDSAMKQIRHQCDTMKTIDSMWYSGSFVCAQIKYGGICTWDLTKDSTEAFGISPLQKVPLNHSNPALNKTSTMGQSACILVGGGADVYNAAWPLDLVYDDLIKFYSVVDTVYKGKFTVDFISDELYKYDLVFLLTHGMSKNNCTYFLTGQKAGIQEMYNRWFGDWKNGIVAINRPYGTGDFANADWILMVTNKFITGRCDNQFKAVLWYAAACNQLQHPEEMGKALVNRGVKEVIGWNCEVNSLAAIRAGEYLIDSMLSRCSSLSESYGFLGINPQNIMYPWDHQACNLTTCYQTPALQETGKLMSYPDMINNSVFKLRTDCVSLPQIPTLTSPTNSATGQTLTPTLTWSTVSGVAAYHVQVSTSNTFLTILMEDSTLTSASKVLTGLTNSTTYYWRVRAKNSIGVSTWTSSWSFTTSTAIIKIDSVTDIDGNVYHTIKIGTQVWTVENLRTTKYNDGSAIPFITDNSTWLTTTSPGYCYYNNTTNADSIKKFGVLYNWYAVNTKKLAPAGWHIPTDAEWDTLENYLIVNRYSWDGTVGNNKIAKSLAAKTDWCLNSSAGAIGNDLTKNNSSGFSALPSGYRYVAGNFNYIGYFGCWWSASGTGADMAYCSSLGNDHDNLIRDNDFEGCGFSVRLVRDN